MRKRDTEQEKQGGKSKRRERQKERNDTRKQKEELRLREAPACKAVRDENFTLWHLNVRG